MVWCEPGIRLLLRKQGTGCHIVWRWSLSDNISPKETAKLLNGGYEAIRRTPLYGRELLNDMYSSPTAAFKDG